MNSFLFHHFLFSYWMLVHSQNILFVIKNYAHLFITGKPCPSLYYWKTLLISLVIENPARLLLLENYAHLFITWKPCPFLYFWKTIPISLLLEKYAHLFISGKLSPSLYYWKNMPISLLLENKTYNACKIIKFYWLKNFKKTYIWWPSVNSGSQLKSKASQHFLLVRQ